MSAEVQRRLLFSKTPASVTDDVASLSLDRSSTSPANHYDGDIPMDMDEVTSRQEFPQADVSDSLCASHVHVVICTLE